MGFKARIALTIFIFMVVATSCTYSGDQDNDSKASVFYLINSGPSDEFFSLMEKGAMDSAEEMNCKLVVRTPKEQGDAMAQLDYLNEAQKAGANGIAIHPISDADVEAKLEELRLSGVIINSFFRGADKKTYDITVGTDSYESGQIAARRALEAIKSSGELLVITDEIAQRSRERAEGFSAYIGQVTSTQSSDVKIYDTVITDGSGEDSEAKVAKILESHPTISMIYATGAQELCGAFQAVSKMKLNNKILLLGFDNTYETRSLLENGNIYGLIVPVPYNVGYMSIRYLKKLELNEVVDATVNTGVRFIKAEDYASEDVKALLDPTREGEVSR